MIHLVVKDMKEAFLQLNLLFTTWSMVDYNPPENKFRNDYYINAFNILLETNHCDTDLKLEQIGYTRKKVDHLLKSYLDPAEYKHWVDLIKDTTERHSRVDSDIVLTTLPTINAPVLAVTFVVLIPLPPRFWILYSSIAVFFLSASSSGSGRRNRAPRRTRGRSGSA